MIHGRRLKVNHVERFFSVLGRFIHKNWTLGAACDKKGYN